MSERPSLQIQRLGHRYDETPALSGVDLEVQAGEFVALLGPSGCGKTTLLRAVAGLICPTAGQICLRGEVVSTDGVERVPTEARRVGLVFQEYALFPHMTVAENIAFGLKTPDPDRVAQLLESVGLPDCADRRPARLSGGQQQRVALARALAPRPTLLLLDEPFANVDATRRDLLAQALLRVVREEGASALLVTHDQHNALSLADRVLVLEPRPNGGETGQLGTPQEVYQRPASRSVAQLTGPCHFVDGVANGDQAQTALGVFRLVEARQGAVTIAVRPHQLRFQPDPEGAVAVTAVHYSGPTYHLVCEGPTGPIEVDWPANSIPPGTGSFGTVSAPGETWALPR